MFYTCFFEKHIYINSWGINPKYPDVNKQYFDWKALPTVQTLRQTGEFLCLWSRTARELPASRLVTGGAVEDVDDDLMTPVRAVVGFQKWTLCWKGGWMWVGAGARLFGRLMLTLSLSLNMLISSLISHVISICTSLASRVTLPLEHE